MTGFSCKATPSHLDIRPRRADSSLSTMTADADDFRNSDHGVDAVQLTTNHEQMEGDGMSLIIAIQNKNGIVFCADTKSTVSDSLGQHTEEQGRDCRKVFRASDIIVATFGRNKLYRNNILVPVEMVIDAILVQNPGIDAERFFALARVAAAESLALDSNSAVNFIVGYRRDDAYIVEHRTFAAGHEARALYYNASMAYFGTSDLCPRNIRASENWSVAEMERAAKAVMRSAIDVGDIFLSYNPVGGSIETVALV